MFTQFITLTATDSYGKVRVVAIPVSNIALMEEHTMGTTITLVSGPKIVVNELIEQVISKIEEDDDDDEDWDDDVDSDTGCQVYDQ